MKTHRKTPSLIRRFIRYCRPHRGLFALDMSMSATRAVMGVLSVSDGLDGTSRVTYRSKKVHPGHPFGKLRNYVGANFRVLDLLDFIALLVAHIPARHEKRAINYGRQ